MELEKMVTNKKNCPLVGAFRCLSLLAMNGIESSLIHTQDFNQQQVNKRGDGTNKHIKSFRNP